MKTLLSTAIAASVAAGAAVAQDYDRTGWPDSFTVGTASQGGTYFAYGSGWANLVAEELGLSGGGEVTGGPMQNMALVHTGDAAFGMTTMGPAAESMAGDQPDRPRPADDQRLRDVPDVPDAVLDHGAVVLGHLVDLRHPGRRAHRLRPGGLHLRHLFPAHDGRARRELRPPQRRLVGSRRPASGRASRRDRLRRRRARPGGEPARGADRHQHHRVHRGGAGDDPRGLPGLAIRDRGGHLPDPRGAGALGLDVELRHRQLRPARGASSMRRPTW